MSGHAPGGQIWHAGSVSVSSPEGLHALQYVAHHAERLLLHPPPRPPLRVPDGLADHGRDLGPVVLRGVARAGVAFMVVARLLRLLLLAALGALCRRRAIHQPAAGAGQEPAPGFDSSCWRPRGTQEGGGPAAQGRPSMKKAPKKIKLTVQRC